MQVLRRATPDGLAARSLGPLLFLGFLVLTWLSIDLLIELDRLVNYRYRTVWPEARPWMAVLVRLGQRAILLPLLFGFAIYVARRRRSWQPVLLSVISVLLTNFLVGVFKLATDRGKPLFGDPFFFQEGLLYPSGHAANAIMYFGLAVWLSRHYGNPDGPLPRILLVLTWVACALMIVTCVYLQFHWITDLVGGLLLGGAVLRSTVYERGVVRRLSEYVEHLARRILATRRARAAATDTVATEPDPDTTASQPSRRGSMR